MWLSEYSARCATLLHVVELMPLSNIPRRKGWPRNRMTPAEAYAEWTSWPTLNIGAIAWPRWWVLDLDGPDAVVWFEGLARVHGLDPLATLTVLTPGRGGGRHMWWQMPPLSEGARLRAWVQGCREAEIKSGPGRQTALPPSRRPEGLYRFDSEAATEPAPTPDWMLPLITRTPRGLGAECPLGWMRLQELIDCEGQWGELGQLMQDGYVDQVRRAREGERNDTLYYTALDFVEMCATDEQFKMLHVAAEEAGLGEHEIERTIESARERDWR